MKKENINYKLKNKNISISLKIKDNNDEKIKDLCDSFFKKIVYLVNSTSLPCDSSLQKKHENTFITPTNAVYNSDTIIRKRLPNDNVYNINDLDIQNAKVQKFLVRCPSCGQAHTIILKQNNDNCYVMVRDFNKQEFLLVCTYSASDVADKDNDLMNLKVDTPEEIQETFELLQKSLKMANKDTDILTEPDNIGICPICHSTNNLSDWQECYKDPSKYLPESYDYYCDVCGREVIIEFSNDHKEKLVCEYCKHDQSYGFRKE